jgi:FkbM family methyltransferase
MHAFKRQRVRLALYLTACLLIGSIITFIGSHNETTQMPQIEKVFGEHMERLPKEIFTEIYPQINYSLVINGSHFCNIQDYSLLVPPYFFCWVADYDGPHKVREIIKHFIDNRVDLGYMIDVGGWIGDTAYAAAAMGMEVYVFEPVAKNYYNLRSSLALNFNSVTDRIHAFNCAVSNMMEKVKIFIPQNGQYDNAALGKEISTMNVGGESETQEIISLPLDHLFKKGCPLILKIDVQGYEFNVLEGATRMLSRCSETTFILTEVVESMMEIAVNKKTEDLVNFLDKLGYRPVETGQDYIFIGKDNALGPIKS